MGSGPIRQPAGKVALLLATLPGLFGLGGCGPLLTATTSSAAGIAGTGIASAVTDNTAVAAGIGLGVAAGASAALQYAQRRVHAATQDSIAAAAGPLPVNLVAEWRIRHSVPIEPDEQGQVAVVRLIGAPGFACKEIVFSVDTVEDRQPRRAFYTAIICRDGERWRWASAEPATERWGALQ
ncbi:hypothetical protein M0638_11005 [Roseomonas sp. NAR14]|uniref:Lipoprotein n=1 Tax=Roseomonas acroporae TaxID=2937791 RepID=A0A9X1Y625_9PROT|nr:hypothetical protein [Roseomonas acroporae]MCK8784909.1 hypothetical protein [Roseomonas acroporae]